MINNEKDFLGRLLGSNDEADDARSLCIVRGVSNVAVTCR